MKILAVVPVRMAAVRFPGKPLVHLDGRPIVEWVYDRARSCSAFDEVVVATDSESVVECVEAFGGAVEMTRDDHETGSDRVAEVAERHPDADVVVNVQGDQPFATADMLEALVHPYVAGESPDMTTLACPITDAAAISDPNVVKLVHDVHGNALYFSRSPIPHARDGDGGSALHHLGLYAFTRDTLLRFRDLRPTPLERIERLEQLRALEHGIQIRICMTDKSVLEINTPQDLEQAQARLDAERGR
ncbi:MAG: 3-deoxy-manno-octulosonate cytidylyltransferase synthetase [Solirubrobacteraceae bacterium]|jgi:3-deoxy-manno-octulosonate cytidylyltransferase (CMP-KDO synthetase)|nr:3-deoxy-manno-octulosonate cytidylyltransferase synthetase [Solirubrobacteraceae bacterium]